MPKVPEQPVEYLDCIRKLPPMDRMLYFIREREQVRLQKEAGNAKPWSQDKILQTYRFCNVRRMDDKVSDWLLNNWYLPYFDHPNMLVACTLARHFNQPHALVHITGQVFGGKNGMPSYKPDVIKKTMRMLKAQGKTIFNGAYMVRGIGTADKTEMVVDKVCQPLVDNPPKLDTNSMQRSVEALLPYWGFSDFMAGQVVADLRWAIKGTWQDRCTWAAMGPGSRRGMNRLLQRDIKTKVSQEEFNNYLIGFMYICKPRLPRSITERMEAIDYQNCHCEFDKYSRCLLGEGRPKQLYPGR